MAEWWRNKYNSWFGSNITFVTNAYNKAEYLWLLFHNEHLSLNKLVLQGSPKQFDVIVTADLERMKITQKVRILYRDIHKKRRNTALEYITIVGIADDGEEVVICENYSIGANRSFIITKEAGIKPQRYGDNNLYMDEFGHDHRPWVCD